MQGRRTEGGIAAGTVVVGTEDESGRQRCGQSQQIMAPWLGQGKAFGRDHLNGGNGFTGNARRTFGLLAGGGSTAPLQRLCHRPCLPPTKGRQVWMVEIAGYKSVIRRSFKFSNQVPRKGGGTSRGTW